MLGGSEVRADLPVELQGPAAYSHLWWWVAGGLVAFVVLYVVAVLWFTRAPKPRSPRKALLAELDAIEADVAAGRVPARVGHQRISSCVRAGASEVTGIPAGTMTLSDLRAWERGRSEGVGGFDTVSPSGSTGSTTGGEVSPSGSPGSTTGGEVSPGGSTGSTTGGEVSPSGSTGSTTGGRPSRPASGDSVSGGGAGLAELVELVYPPEFGVSDAVAEERFADALARAREIVRGWA
ncbi:hypothetical protein [Nocardioides acrostichi]|uniref:Uncharacterized protein n=1 Tax=Nocardioides acrostichi TaxID=2784339 RepID=A0A930YCZ1_9ACTN|nr:hypothetical protein [Nocardioides acrostichi]MBF4164003.1 hypothetical protein [Nocardioides acrostichi]